MCDPIRTKVTGVRRIFGGLFVTVTCALWERSTILFTGISFFLFSTLFRLFGFLMGLRLGEVSKDASAPVCNPFKILLFNSNPLKYEVLIYYRIIYHYLSHQSQKAYVFERHTSKTRTTDVTILSEIESPIFNIKRLRKQCIVDAFLEI